jgi:putative heme iron utilization protein
MKQDMFNLLLENGTGVLGTHSVEEEGFPFGSTTPYCLDDEFRPLILISDLAQHTKNIQANDKVCLFVNTQTTETNKQAFGRLSYLAHAQQVKEEAMVEKYISYFPEAREYFSAHKFMLYRLVPHRVRYIGGFGKIFWVEKDELAERNLFSYETQKPIVEHMNQDHQHNLKDYARAFFDMDSEEVKLNGIDQWGFDMSVDKIKVRYHFEKPMTQVNEARSVFVDLAKKAKA